MSPASPRTWRATGLVPLGVALATFLVFHAIGQRYLAGYAIALGMVDFPTMTHGLFMLCWALFGSIAAGFGAVGLARAATWSGLSGWLVRRFATGADRPWILVGMAAALTIPLLIRHFVLMDLPITDDEGIYRFMAELLASGRVHGDSPPGKLHFDLPFMVNDGKWYGQYFLGWPLLMALGVPLASTGCVNAVLAAITVPALFGSLRRVAGRPWARAGLLIYLTSPFLMGLAATELAHTSCLAALCWAARCWLRTRDEDPPAWAHAGLATAFSLAFLIRPLTALGVGAPFVVLWLWDLRGARGRTLALRLVAFAIPAGLLAGLFLWINQAQTDSPLTVAYQAAIRYQVANGYQFAFWPPGGEPAVANLRPLPFLDRLAGMGTASLRLNFALFGWPSSFLFAALAWMGGRRAWPWLASLACFLLLHSGLHDAGIDTLGPNHFTETALPILVLTVLGLRGITKALERVDWPTYPLRSLPAALLATLLLLNLAGYTPVRYRAVHKAAMDIAQPFDAVERAGAEDVVVFCYRGFIHPRHQAPGSNSFLRWHPAPSPDLSDPVWWVNHVDIEADKAFMALYPERTGFVMVWKDEQPVFLPLDSLAPGDLPVNELLMESAGD